MYSTHESNDISTGAMTPALLSFPAARMLFKALVLQMLTSRSPGR